MRTDAGAKAREVVEALEAFGSLSLSLRFVGRLIDQWYGGWFYITLSSTTSELLKPDRLSGFGKCRRPGIFGWSCGVRLRRDMGDGSGLFLRCVGSCNVICM